MDITDQSNLAIWIYARDTIVQARIDSHKIDGIDEARIRLYGRGAFDGDLEKRPTRRGHCRLRLICLNLVLSF